MCFFKKGAVAVISIYFTTVTNSLSYQWKTINTQTKAVCKSMTWSLLALQFQQLAWHMSNHRDDLKAVNWKHNKSDYLYSEEGYDQSESYR